MSKPAEKNAVERIQLQYTVTEDGYVYQGIIEYDKANPPSEAEIDAEIDAAFAAWKQVMGA